MPEIKTRKKKKPNGQLIAYSLRWRLWAAKVFRKSNRIMLPALWTQSCQQIESGKANTEDHFTL